SGGMQDVSGIRDYIKYAYDNWTIKPEYVLLFGDGDYDYKDIEGKHQNFVIPYESYESLHNINSYASDDFYVCVSGRDLIVDLAIGRINVTTASEAKAAVDKIIKYETTEQPGTWRNLITLVADDAYTSSGFEGNYHNAQSEELSQQIPSSFDQNKIYEVFYQTVQTSLGRRKPQVNQAIIDAVNSGTLILNWIGHGNPDVWAHEYVFEKGSTIAQLTNERYCFLTAATCDFGRYDSPDEQSSTELMLLKADAGLIGAFTSARTVYSSDNAALNELFYSKLLSADSAGNYKPIGKAYMLTKMEKNQLNDLKFHLFGDPTLRLLVPRMNLAIDSLNGLPATETANVKALSKLSLSGSVRNQDKTVASQSGGEALITIYDSERLVPSSELSGYQIRFQGGIIYKGLSSIKDGRFSTSFTVPKDISYENKPGKVEAYLQSGTNDALGFTKNIVIGGSDSSAVNDRKGPEVEIAFDRLDGVNSVLVSPDFTLYVKLKDETGINTTGSGIGHRLEAVLNGNENSPIDLSGEFTGDLDSGGKSGVIRHQFTGMAPGSYKVKVKVWDVFNNPGEQEKTFTVTDNEGLVVRDVYNYPNPFKDRTTFSFQHNLNEAVNVIVKVYTVSGRMIRQIEGRSISDRFVRLDWDGRDEDGNLAANGTYLYKIVVKSISDSYSKELLGKLAVVR
ncbi:MAG: type IX secretion system sortase PorU, partial [Syntrophothermus sp.]